jgi:hypothetical protein
MTHPTQRQDLLPLAALPLLLSIAATLHAQRPPVRDSAGIEVVTNAAPSLPASRVLGIDPHPVLVIGTGSDVPDQLWRVRGAARLANGSIVVADAGSTELRLFDAQGRFVKLLGRKGGGPGELSGLLSVVHLDGDTLAVIVGIGRAVYYDGSGTFLWNVNHYTSPFDRRFTGMNQIAGAFADGSTVIVPVTNPSPRARGERWMMTAPVALIDRSGATLRALGDLPYSQVVMAEYARPPWFAAPLAIANNGESFYIGLGTEYSIREYARDGRLVRIIRRAWTPVRVTGADIDSYVIEWGKRWIRSSGAEAERKRADLRDDPYESVVPAFSQFVADRAGRLWVRTPELRDAPGGGQLNTMPLVPSTWSVFDRNGRWLCNVVLPAYFQPMEIGLDYVLAVTRDDDGVETVVLHRLSGG